jgi:hypothetical protein
MEILIVCAVLFVGVVYGYYTVRGSGIAEHPYGKVYGGSPGALGSASASGRDERVSISTWTRGTR